MTLKWIFSFLVLVLFSCSRTDQKTDESAIRDINQKYEETFNQQDAEGLISYWGKNSIYVNPQLGEIYTGKEEILNYFKERFQEWKGATLEIKIRSIIFPEPDQAVEIGTAYFTLPNGETREIEFKAILLKEKGKWLFEEKSDIESEDIQPEEHLKNLAWLVGKWVDQDENVDIISDNSFDRNKNFLTQNFNLQIFGKEKLNVRQMIGWDPILQQIRSWIFDSDGGFGEGKWSQNGDVWTVESSYTLPDGRKASAMHIYTKIDDDTYTWSSTGRDIDGELLPNIEPVQVVRADEGGTDEK